MATGGTIPSARKNIVTFYNTTGVIEKDKNVYFAPRFSKYPLSVSKKVSKAYIDILDSVCPPSSNYKGIELSGWLPQDRTIVVKGNIDDFRLVTEEGDCLNYFIIQRKVTKGLVEKTYYYGFFITGVKQAGGNSVSITCEPDDFTNVFYLHNEHVLTSQEGDYEPFNEKIKNCYINRQHYNRVKKTVDDYYIMSLRIDSISPSISESSIHVGDSISMRFETEDLPEVVGTVLSFEILTSTSLSLSVKTNEEEDIGEPQQYSQMNIAGSVYNFDYRAEDIEWEHKVDTEIFLDNMKVFLNQEETFRYKYQYRDYKRDLYQHINFTDSEYQEIDEASSLSDLSETLRLKVIYDSLYFLVVETRGMEIVSKYTRTLGLTLDTQLDSGNLIGSLRRPNLTISYPMLSGSKFTKFKAELEKIDFLYSLPGVSTETGNYYLYSAKQIYYIINKMAISVHI